MPKVEVEINEIRLGKDLDETFKVVFSHWNAKVNDGEGGYLFGHLEIIKTRKGIEIINNSHSKIPVKFKQFKKLKIV